MTLEVLKEKKVDCGREGEIVGTMQLNLLGNGGVDTIEETGIQNFEEVFSCQLLKSPLFLSEQAVRV